MRYLTLLLLSSLILLIAPVATKATNLGPGDAAIVQVTANANDNLTFVLLTDISDTTTIYITTQGYDSGLNALSATPGGTLTWTYIGTLSCGTEVRITDTPAFTQTTHGTVAKTGNTNFGGVGDQLLMFHGTGPTSVTDFIWAFDYTGNGWTTGTVTSYLQSNLPIGLTDGLNAFATAAHFDNWQYNCTNSTVAADTMRMAMCNNANWIASDTTEYGAPNCTYFCPVVCNTTVSITVDSVPTCTGYSDAGATAVPANGTPPYTYQWSSGPTTASITGIFAGFDLVTVTDNNGCTASNSMFILDPPMVSAGIATDSTVSCTGAADAGLTVTPGTGTSPYTVVWNTTETTTSITGLTSGSYTVTVTDANGCMGINTTILDPPPMLASFSMIDSMATCDAPGGATMTAFGGTGTVTYLWSNGATTSSIAGVGPGVYSVTATDANGCTTDASIDLGGACATPTGLNIKFEQDVSASVQWDVVCNAIAYRAWYKPVGTSTWFYEQRNTNVGAVDITGLTPGTNYMVRIQAKCSSGWSALSSAVTFKTLDNPCVIPDGLATSPVQVDKARLNWNKQTNSWKYRIRWREVGATSWNFVEKDSVWNKHWLTGLTAATTYEWKIKSVCEKSTGTGTKWSATETFTTPTSKWDLAGAPAAEATVDFTVYPNPNNGEFAVTISNPQGEQIMLEVYNPVGQLVQRTNVTSTSLQHLNLRDTGAGIYTVRLLGETTLQVQRVSIQ